MIAAVLILVLVPPSLFEPCYSPPHCLLFIPFRQTAVQLALLKKNQARRGWLRPLTCHRKGNEEEKWPQLSLFWRRPTHALPFAQALLQAPAVLGRPAVLRSWSSRRKEEAGNPQCQTANALFYFILGNASCVLFCLFSFIFCFKSRRESPDPSEKAQTFAFLSFSHICHDLDLPAVLKQWF